MSKIILYRGLKEQQRELQTSREQFLDAHLSWKIAQRERDVESGKLKSRARQSVIGHLDKLDSGVAQFAEKFLPDPNKHAKKLLHKAQSSPHINPAQQFSDSLDIALKYAGENGYVVSISPEYAEVEEYEWGTNHESVQIKGGGFISMPYTLYEIPTWELTEHGEQWHMKEQSVKDLREHPEESNYESRGEGRMVMR